MQHFQHVLHLRVTSVGVFNYTVHSLSPTSVEVKLQQIVPLPQLPPNVPHKPWLPGNLPGTFSESFDKWVYINVVKDAEKGSLLPYLEDEYCVFCWGVLESWCLKWGRDFYQASLIFDSSGLMAICLTQTIPAGPLPLLFNRETLFSPSEILWCFLRVFFWSSLRVSPQAAVEMQSSEGLTGAGGSVSRLAHSHTWPSAGCRQEASVPWYVGLSRGCRSSAFNDITVGSPQRVWSKEWFKSWNVVYTFTLMSHSTNSSRPIGYSEQPYPMWGRGDYIKSWVPVGRDHCRPS